MSPDEVTLPAEPTGGWSGFLSTLASMGDRQGAAMKERVNAGALRRQFRIQLFGGLRVVWPILFVLLGLMAALGLTVALLEDWSPFEGVYFAFVSGLTIGYGDLAPKTLVGRVLAISIGFLGILLTGLVAAVGVQALQSTAQGFRNGGGRP